MHSKQIGNESSRASFSRDLSNYRMLRLFIKERLGLCSCFFPRLGWGLLLFMRIMVLVMSWKSLGHLRIECSQFYLPTDWCGQGDKVCVPQSGSRISDLLSMANCGEAGSLVTNENEKRRCASWWLPEMWPRSFLPAQLSSSRAGQTAQCV